jgi:hypothetical protein
VSLPSYDFRIDWSADGTFTGTGENVTARVLARDGVVVSYGRDQDRALSPMAPGTASFLLNNISKDYSPEYSSSPLVGNVLPSRPVRLQATHNSTTYTLFRGFTDNFEVLPNRMDRSVSVSCLDAMAGFRDIEISTPVYDAIQTGTAIGYILDAISWPSGDRDLDAGATTIRFWWEEGTDAWAALEKVLAAEGTPALVYVDPSTNKFVFRDRHHRLIRTASTTSQVTFRDSGSEPRYSEPLGYDHGWRDIVNNVRISTDVRKIDTALSAVWESDNVYSLGASEVVTIDAEASEPFRDAVTPVAGTDYVLSSGAVTVTLSRTSGQSTTITLTAGGSGCRITDLKLRANTIPVVRTVQANKSDSTSITKYRTRSAPTEVDAGHASVNDAQAIAQLLVTHRKDKLPILKLRVVGANDTRLTQILSRKISDRVTVINAELGMTTGSDFFIESITHQIDEAGKVHSVVLGLEKVPAGIQSPTAIFKFDTAGQGFNDGVFAY